jgi:RNA recognition motif-containing protein
MSIFISNIHFDANEEDIAALLTSHGLQIRRVDLFRDRSTGNSRGVAVVDLEDPRDIENIIRSLQGLGLSLNGRAIFMKPNERRERRVVRCRTVGDRHTTGFIESEASTPTEVLDEILRARTSERAGRVEDGGAGTDMESRKRLGWP